MTVKECSEKIDSYLEGASTYPLIVDFANIDVMNSVIEKYGEQHNLELVSVSKFCREDKCPQFDSLYNDLMTSSKNVLLYDYIFSLRLLGKDVIKDELKNAVNISTYGKILIFTLNCRAFLKFTDPKISRRIVFVDSDRKIDYVPKLVFTRESSMPKSEIYVNGIDKLFNYLRTSKSKIIFVNTDKSSEDFPDSLYNIEDMKTAYRALAHKYSQFYDVDENYFDEQQWKKLNDDLERFDSLESFYNAVYGDYKNLDKFIFNWQKFNKWQKELYVLGLKLFYSGHDWCLNYAVNESSGANDFVKNIYRSISDLDFRDKDYKDKYATRKEVIKSLGAVNEEAEDYCRRIEYKGKDALYYLSDITQIEKETIINVIGDIGDEKSIDELKEILKFIYKDLYFYLEDYNFDNDFLNRYFKMYKYQKVINKLLPKFKQQVEDQARNREYLEYIMPRISVVSNLDKENCELIFFDALGVEYLSYIQNKAAALGLKISVNVCRSELPSLTEYN